MVDHRQTEAWVIAAAQGDGLALRKLLAAYHPLLRARVATRMDRGLRARVEPEDILQQVYLDVFRRIGHFEQRGPDAFVNWVLTIADNKLVDLRRALHAQMRDVDREMPPGGAGGAESCWNLLDQLYTDSQTPSRVVRKDEAVGALLACLSELSESHRQVLRLRFLEGRPVSDIAKVLGKSPGAVVALSKRALEALRAAMDHLGDFTRGP